VPRLAAAIVRQIAEASAYVVDVVVEVVVLRTPSQSCVRQCQHLIKLLTLRYLLL